jgi:regulator of protease activity HflC (stomatin/prohibitin superfamily)
MKVLLIVLALLSIGYWIIAKAGKLLKNSYDKKLAEYLKEKENDRYAEKPTKNGFILGNSVLFLIIPIVLIVLVSFITIIPAQKCGVVITPGGVLKKSYNTGWHFILPIYKVKTMEKTAQVYTCARTTNPVGEYKDYKADATQSGTIWAPTADGIKMGFDISASWAIDPEYAWWIYDNVSEEDGSNKGRFLWLEENVIKAKLKSALALTVSKYNPIEVYSNKRQNIQDEVFEKMKKDIQSYHLALNQVDVREVYYNPEYETAINAKKLEEQKVLTLIEVTRQKREQEIQAGIDKNIAILKAEGEAKALQIKGQSVVNNPKIVELEWVNKWNGQLPTYMLGNGQNTLIGLK